MPDTKLLGGVITFFTAYSYVELGVYYKEEGATYSCIKQTFPDHLSMASLVRWLVIFGYISTISVYFYTISTTVITERNFRSFRSL